VATCAHQQIKNKGLIFHAFWGSVDFGCLGLAVFSESEVAFGASHELGGWLVCSSGLNQPDIGSVVAASGALYTDCGKRAQVLLFVYHRYQLLGAMMYYLNDFWRQTGKFLHGFFAFGANKLN
jgi:hypothetical protein